MLDLRAQLDRCLDGRIAWVGLGNVAAGDDGFGVRLAEALERRACPRVADPGLEPERWLSRLETRGLDHVVFLDAADFGAPPGSAVFLDRDAMRARFPQVSTHRLSLGLLAEWVESRSRDGEWETGDGGSALGQGRGTKGEDRGETEDRTADGGPALMTDVPRCFRSGGRPRAWLLGAQPESMRPGTGLTDAMRVTVEALSELIAGFCEQVGAKAAPTATL